MFWGISGNAHQRSLKASEEKRQKPTSHQYVICHEAVWLVVWGVTQVGNTVSTGQESRIVSRNDLERFHVKA